MLANPGQRIQRIVSAPRIIGLVCVIIAGVCYYYDLSGWLGLGIAGAVLMLSPTNYGKKVFAILVKSFRLGKWFALSMLYDVLFWLGFTLVLIGCYAAFSSKVNALAKQLSKELTLELLQTNASLMKSLLVTLVIVGIIAFIATILFYTIFKGLIWLALFNKKPSFSFFKKFLVLNLAWWLAWAAVIILIGFSARPETLPTIAPLAVIVCLHFTTILHTNFLQTEKIGESFGKALSQGTTKIHHFILPYAYLFLVYIALFQIYRIIPLQGKTSFIASMLFVIAYFAWLRKFIKTIIQTIVQKS